MRAILLALLVLFCGSHAAAQDAVPALVAIAEAGAVEDFAKALVARGVPVGVVVLKEDAAKGRGSGSAPPPLAPGELSVAVAAFQDRRKDYAVDIQPDGAVLITPSAPGGCREALVSRRRSIDTSGPILDVLYRLYRTWSDATTQYIPPGFIGSSSDFPQVFSTPVSVTIQAGTLQEALNSLLRQVNGLGWNVRQLPIPKSVDETTVPVTGFSCNLSLITGQARLATSWTITIRGSHADGR